MVNIPKAEFTKVSETKEPPRLKGFFDSQPRTYCDVMVHWPERELAFIVRKDEGWTTAHLGQWVTIARIVKTEFDQENDLIRVTLKEIPSMTDLIGEEE